MRIGITCYPTVGGSGILATRLGLELVDRGERLIDRLRLKEHVLMTGYRSDVPHLLRCSDVVVLCSETESALSPSSRG